MEKGKKCYLYQFIMLFNAQGIPLHNICPEQTSENVKI